MVVDGDEPAEAPHTVDLTRDDVADDDPNPDAGAGRALALLAAVVGLGLVAATSLIVGRLADTPPSPSTASPTTPPASLPTPTPRPPSAESWTELLGFASTVWDEIPDEVPVTRATLLAGADTLCGSFRIEPRVRDGSRVWYEVGPGPALDIRTGPPPEPGAELVALMARSVGGAALAPVGEGLLVRPMYPPVGSFGYWTPDAGLVPLPINDVMTARVLGTNGDLALVVDGDSVGVLDVATASRVTSAPLGALDLHPVRGTPQLAGSIAALAGIDGSVTVVDLAAGSALREVGEASGPTVWLSDSELVITAPDATATVVRSVDIDTGTTRDLVRLTGGDDWYLVDEGHGC